MAALSSLAVIVSQGETNRIIQAATVLMAAVHADWRVRVLFRDEAVFRLQPGKINALEFSAAYGTDVEALRNRLKKLDLTDIHKLLRDIKASGDVKYYACSSSLAICGAKREDLIPEIDGVRGLPAFLIEDMAEADRVLTF